MAKFQTPCSCIDYPCCGCGGETVLTGQDAVDFDEQDQFLSDAEADGDALASAGLGTDEDYYGGCDLHDIEFEDRMCGY